MPEQTAKASVLPPDGESVSCYFKQDRGGEMVGWDNKTVRMGSGLTFLACSGKCHQSLANGDVPVTADNCHSYRVKDPGRRKILFLSNQ